MTVTFGIAETDFNQWEVREFRDGFLHEVIASGLPKRKAEDKRDGLAWVAGIQAIEDRQRGRCAICHHAWSALLVDHCHFCGLVRGLLCNSCNTTEACGGSDTFRAWATAYRANPPTLQIGLQLQYAGRHAGMPYNGTPDCAWCYGQIG